MMSEMAMLRQQLDGFRFADQPEILHRWILACLTVLIRRWVPNTDSMIPLDSFGQLKTE
jgi:hypothetical protein